MVSKEVRNVKPRTYTQVQYMTESSKAMIRRWLDTDKPTEEDIERVAKYMRDTLRIGGIRVCRALIREAIK